MTLKNSRAPLLCYANFCASFHGHQWNQTVRKHQIQVKIDDFFTRVTLKFHRWPRKTMGHYYFKLWSSLHSNQWNQTAVTVQKRPIRVKIDYVLSHLTLKLGRWHWKKIGHLFYGISSSVNHFVAISEFKLELRSQFGNAQFGSKSAILVPCDLEIWMTLKNNRAPLLCHTDHCASLHCHMWNQNGVTVRKRPNWFLTSVMTFCVDITSVIGNNSSKFHDDTMMGTYWKRCYGRTDRRTGGRTTGGRTDRTIHRATRSQLKTYSIFEGPALDPHWFAGC